MYPLTSVFGNLVYLGLPITSSILGHSGLELAVFVVLIHALVFFTFGIIWIGILTYGSITTKRLLQISMRNPLIISSLTGASSRYFLSQRCARYMKMLLIKIRF